MAVRFASYDAAFVARVRAGGVDDYGLSPERAVSGGVGVPCRCCLDLVPAGAEMLIIAARPFSTLHPYAETGPIFLCAEDCAPWDGEGAPPILTTSPDYLLKAYSAEERIIYSTGGLVPAGELIARAEALFAEARVAYVDVRSARNNCFLTRIFRA
jgi:hypothetical protein